MPFVNGTWVDDATGVPDPSMPQGMGDPAGAIVPAAQQTLMAPQQINPTPMGPQRPVPGPQIPQMLLDPEQAGITPQEVSPPLTGSMVSQEWNRINRPEMTGGDIAKAIISAPLTAPIGIIEELRGLFGGDTIEGWAQQANDRYSNPNFNESRAFGVKGTAKTPEFGDRFLGVVKGTAQAGATRGILMRNEIGRYNKQRAAEISTFKDVGDIYQQSQALQKGAFGLQTQEEEFKARMDARRAAARASGASASLSEYTLQKKQEDAATVAQLAEAIAADPSLADGQHNSALMSLAKGNLNLVKQALETTKLGREMPDVSGLTPSVKIPMLAGQAGDIARAYGDVATTEGHQAYEQAKIDAENARKDAETQRAAAEAERIRAGSLETDLAKEARDRVAGFYKGREDTLQPRTYFGQNEDLMAQLKELQAEQARVQGFLQSGALPRADAYAIASGDYDPLATPLDQPTPMPTTVSPTPRPTATPRPADYESPADVRARVLRDEMSKLGIGGVRPTPMATPSPTPTRAGAGTMNEDARRANADKLARFTPQFQAKWQAQHPDKPMRGPLYESEFKRNATANGIVVESLQ